MRRLASLLLFTALTAGCSGTAEYSVVGNERAAGADGVVRVEEIENGSRLVTISVEHLPPPSRLGPNLTAYVAWFIPNGQPPVRAGALAYDEDTRAGSATATSPDATFEIRITAERSTTVSAPGDVVVMTRRVGN